MRKNQGHESAEEVEANDSFLRKLEEIVLL